MPEFFGKNSVGAILNIHKGVLNKFNMNEEDVIDYLYAVFHHPMYLNTYRNDLKKGFPRIPLLNSKREYVEVGRKLSELHLNYEHQPIWNGVEVVISKSNPDYRVNKMKHPKKGVLDTIIYNDHIIIKNIPEKAYEYVVNGRIEGIIDQYRVKTDKKSGITDNPNEYSDNSKYILNLLLSVITASIRTLELIDELPNFEIDKFNK